MSRPFRLALLAPIVLFAAADSAAAQSDTLLVEPGSPLVRGDAIPVHSSRTVLRAGKHPMREINAALRAFQQGGVQVDGAVLNDVQVRMGYANYGGYHYQYAYKQK